MSWREGVKYRVSSSFSDIPLLDQALAEGIDDREQTAVGIVQTPVSLEILVGIAGLLIGPAEEDREIPDRLVELLPLQISPFADDSFQFDPFGAGAVNLVAGLLENLLRFDGEEGDMRQDIIDLALSVGDDKTHLLFRDRIGHPAPFQRNDLFERGVLEVLLGREDDAVALLYPPRHPVYDILQSLQLDYPRVRHRAVDLRTEHLQGLRQFFTGLARRLVHPLQGEGVSQGLEGADGVSGLLGFRQFLHRCFSSPERIFRRQHPLPPNRGTPDEDMTLPRFKAIERRKMPRRYFTAYCTSSPGFFSKYFSGSEAASEIP